MFDTLTWDYQAPPSVSCVVCRHGNLSHPFFSYTPFSVTPTSPLPQNAQNFEYCGTSRLYCRSITRRRIPHNAVYHTTPYTTQCRTPHTHVSCEHSPPCCVLRCYHYAMSGQPTCSLCRHSCTFFLTQCHPCHFSLSFK